jgi:hypothetical protein
MKAKKINENDESNLYQDDSLRNENGLIYRMRDLFNRSELTYWQYNAFKRIIFEYAKSKNLYFDDKQEILYKIK